MHASLHQQRARDCGVELFAAVTANHGRRVVIVHRDRDREAVLVDRVYLEQLEQRARSEAVELDVPLVTRDPQLAQAPGVDVLW